jgi:preprotein translocase subunit SecF
MSFAIAAVVALLHDILVVLGVYSIVSYYLGAQLDTLFVTALLTTMSFSVHDTIVIFDMIRDELNRGKTTDIATLSDLAVTSTLVRSLNNSLTIVFMLLSLVLLGGSSITFFAVALLIGTVTGVYSSPFVATPVMVWLESRMK